MPLDALPFQRSSVRTTEQEFNGRSLIASDMGLGKTYTSLWFVKRRRLGDTFPLLVVCPKIVRTQWVEAIKEILNIQPDILETRTPSIIKHPSQVAIINYDIAPYWRDWLEEQNYRTLIIDECQRCKNPKAKRTKTTLAIGKQTPFCLALSGTPLENAPIELFPIINCLNPKAWPNRNVYAHKFCGPKFTRRGWTFKGSTNRQELHLRLKQTCMVRYTKPEVLHELPDKIRTIVPVELNDYEQYQKAMNDFVGWMKSTYPDRLNKSVKSAALVKSGHLLRLAARLKLQSVVEWINFKLEQNPSEKMVVYAVHRKCVAALERRIKFNSVVVNGTVTGHKREVALAKFRNDPNTPVLVANIAAAGIGLNLTHATLSCIVELVQKPGPLIQVEDRIYRMGQKKKCWIYYFIGLGTIEESISKLVQRKQKVLTGTLDGEETEDDFDLYDLLLAELEQDPKWKPPNSGRTSQVMKTITKLPLLARYAR